MVRQFAMGHSSRKSLSSTLIEPEDRMFEDLNAWKDLMGRLTQQDQIHKEDEKLAKGKPSGCSDARLRAMAAHYWQSLRDQPDPDPETSVTSVDDYHADLVFRLNYLSDEENKRFHVHLNELKKKCGK